jgi:hypothetical protein
MKGMTFEDRKRSKWRRLNKGKVGRVRVRVREV